MTNHSKSRIIGITAKNYLCFSDLKLDLRTPSGSPVDLAVISGPNGSGKSTLLGAILDNLFERALDDVIHEPEVGSSFCVEYFGGLPAKWALIDAEDADRSFLISSVRDSLHFSGGVNRLARRATRQNADDLLEALCSFWSFFGRSTIELRELAHNNPSGLEKLSTGELFLLWVGVRLTGSARIFDGVLLMDRPEAYLDDAWQRKIIPGIRMLAPDAQIIVASNSSYIWDAAYSWERFSLAPWTTDKTDQ